MPIVDPGDPNAPILSQYDLGFEPNNATFTGAQIVHPVMEVIHQGRVDGFDVYAAVISLRISNLGTAANGLLIYGDQTIGDLIRVENGLLLNRYDLLLTKDGRLGIGVVKGNGVQARLEVAQADSAVIGQILFAKDSTGADLLQAVNNSGQTILWVDVKGQLRWKDSQSTIFQFPSGNPLPDLHNLVSWNFDPSLSGGTAKLVEQTIYLQKFYVPEPSTLSSVMLNVTNATPVGGTQSYIGLYSTGGTKLAESADVSTQFETTGMKTISFTTPYVADTGYYYTAILVGNNPGLGPDLSTSGGATDMNNVNLTGADLRFASGPTGQTSLPSSITMSSNIAPGAITPWVGVK